MNSFSTPQVEPGRLSDWLLWEEDDHGRYSREIVVIGPNQTLKSGAPIGASTVAGQSIEYDNVDGGGGGAVTGILIEDVTTGTDPVKSVAIVRMARIAPSKLQWKSGLDQTGKDAGLADLKALGIVPVPAEV